MKLLRVGEPGFEIPAILDGAGQARSLAGIAPDIAGDVLTPDGLRKLAAIDPETLPVIHGRIGPCVGQVGKFICIGLNYADHAAESGLTVPPEPVIFIDRKSVV